MMPSYEVGPLEDRRVSETKNPTALESQNHFAILKTTIPSQPYILIDVIERLTGNETLVGFQNIRIDVETVYVITELHVSR